MLMENDYRYGDIDDMDLLGYFDTVIYKILKDEAEARDRLLSLL